METTGIGLSSEQFEKIGAIVHEQCGIELTLGKEALVNARLTKRLRALGLTNFNDYVKHLEVDKSGEELYAMIESLTTNKTSFFRESPHFDLLRQHILPSLRGLNHGIKIWSAGCSSGEEPYSIAITLRDALPSIESGRAKVLATDISAKVLDKARRAIYSPQDLRNMPLVIVDKYFAQVKDGKAAAFRVKDVASSLVRFAQLNLMNQWPMTGPFDAIFCRNVMIYFDKPTRQNLITRFGELLAPGGYLLVGHSESLTGMAHDFTYVQPAVYTKRAKP